MTLEKNPETVGVMQRLPAIRKKNPELPSIPSKSEPDSTKARATPPGGQGQGGFVCE